jgi:amidase
MNNSDSEEKIIRLQKELKRLGKDSLDKVFDGHEIDVIAAPADSGLCVHAAAAGK